MLEHKQVVEELNRDLQERDNRIDEVTLEYEAKLKVLHISNKGRSTKSMKSLENKAKLKVQVEVTMVF